MCLSPSSGTRGRGSGSVGGMQVSCCPAAGCWCCCRPGRRIHQDCQRRTPSRCPAPRVTPCQPSQHRPQRCPGCSGCPAGRPRHRERRRCHRRSGCQRRQSGPARWPGWTVRKSTRTRSPRRPRSQPEGFRPAGGMKGSRVPTLYDGSVRQPAEVWRSLRRRRAAPPGSASSSPSRADTFRSALEQAEQQFRAAASVDYDSRALNLYSGASQAGRALGAWVRKGEQGNGGFAVAVV